VANSSSFLAVIVSGSLNKKIKTLLIFVSITGTDKFRANAIIAAEVYGPTHGNFFNSSLFFGNFLFATIFAHACNLNALELNPSPDRFLSKSVFVAFAKLV
jgi:hypothetical protein